MFRPVLAGEAVYRKRNPHIKMVSRPIWFGTSVLLACILVPFVFLPARSASFGPPWGVDKTVAASLGEIRPKPD